ncbi:MAG: T9SS type A sorting domain-containing protein [Bacteroidales bacterium]|nr:T9SS type A sorting domain-containing protein [Bacteroidales bacterium]
MKKQKLIIFLMLMFFGSYTFSQTIIKTIKFNLPEIKTDKDGFSSILYKDAKNYGNEGNPKIPHYSVSILLPQGCEIDNIKIVSQTYFPGLDGITIQPAARQFPLSMMPDEGEYKVVPNQEIYSSNQAYPVDILESVKTHFLAGHSIGSFSVCPISFIPSEQHVDFLDEIILEIALTSTSKAVDAQKFLKTSTIVENRIKKIVDNPEKLSEYSYNSAKDDDEIDILLITKNDFVSAFDTYLEFKESTGFACSVKTVEEIYSEYSGQDDQEKIRNCIIDYYETYGISYVILGGDGDGDNTAGEVIPHRGFYNVAWGTTEDDIPADIYYSNLDGNWNADGDNKFGEIGEEDFYSEVAIGRICADNTTKILNQTNKLELYQNAPVVDDIEKALFLGELLWSDPTWGGDYKDEVADGSSNHGYTTVGLSDNITCTKLYEKIASWNKQDVFYQASTVGVNLRNHLGHSNVDYCMLMYNPDLTTSNFQNNGISRGFMIGYSQGCYNGAFDNRGTYGYEEDCFSEIITTIETADVANIGNSRYGWGQHSSTDGASQYFDRQFFDAIFGEDITEIGWSNADSKEDNVPFIDGEAIRWCYYELNLFGDPSMDIWTAVPTDFAAAYPASIPIGSSQLAVQTAVAFARVALVQNGELIGRGVADESGSIIVYTFSPIIDPSPISISIIGHNKNRHQGNIVIVSDEPYVIFDSKVLNDDAGNGNGILDYNESVTLSVGLKNVGNQPTNDVVATISSENIYVSISDNTETYGDFDPEELIFIEDAFAFAVSADVPDGEAILFKITAESGETAWESYFSIVAHAPELNFVEFEILGNGKIDPGETTEISVSVDNTGSSDAYDVIAELISSSQYMTVNSDPQSLGILAPEDLGEVIFSVTASANTPAGQMVDFIVDISASLGITASGEFTVIVGQIPVLILDFDENNNSANYMQSAINEIGVSCELMSSMPADLNLYSSIFICLGIYSDNHVLSSDEGSILADYLNNGGMLYMEGGDTWYYDNQTPVHSMFNINGQADGSGDMGTVAGQNGTFTEGMSFNYSGDNNWMDHIGANSPAVLIFENQSPNYGCAVAYDADDYKTIGASFEFGGLDDGSSTKLDLMTEYIIFFDLYPAIAETQSIELATGYQFVSSRIDVENSDMLVVLQDILTDNLDYVRNSEGTVLRKIGPNWVNGIGDWISTEGYLIKMLGAETLALTGAPLNPLTPIDLTTGYQFVSYLPDEPIDAIAAFENILTDNLDYIRNSNGEMLRKIGPNWVNGLGYLNPGEGYLIKMFANDQLVYNGAADGVKSTYIPKNMNHFTFEGGNAADPVYSIYVAGLNIGDEVAVYDGDKMVGASVVISENTLENSVPIFSVLTEGLGYESNNEMILKVWDVEYQAIVSATYTFDNNYTQAFNQAIFPETDGQYSVLNVTKGSLGIMEAALEVNIYPNPASDVLNIVSNNTITRIRVMNFVGQRILDNIVNETSLNINTSAYQSGVYIVSVETSNGVRTEKITIK